MKAEKKNSRKGEALAFFLGFLVVAVPGTMWLLSLPAGAVNGKHLFALMAAEFLAAFIAQISWLAWKERRRKQLSRSDI